jgi:hypothetical protein
VQLVKEKGVITRILSSAEPGVELAALDVARKLGIPHGGWTSRGRHRHNTELLSIYQLKETPSFGFQEAVEKNVIDADGTLLISHGEKDQRLRYAVEMALKHERQFLHVDLKQYPAFEAASLINSWVTLQKTKRVFITGRSEEAKSKIYNDAHRILETAVYLGFVKSDLLPWHGGVGTDVLPGSKDEQLPQSVAEAVERLKETLPLKERTIMANMKSNELAKLRSGLGEYIKQKFGLYGTNSPLLKSCADVGKLSMPLAEEACGVIIRALWKDLQATHKLRVLK